MTYPKPSLAVDGVVISYHKDIVRVLLIRRKNEPFKGSYALPGGFVEPNEMLTRAAVREVLEETNLDLSSVVPMPLAIRSKPNRDLRGWIISQPYLFHVKGLPDIKASDDARLALWVKLEDLNEPLAFDHGAILCEALGKYWKQFPSYNYNLPDINIVGNVYNDNSRDITIIFPGSFNPWHEGHEYLATVKPKNQIIIVPDTSPDKINIKSTDCQWMKFISLWRKCKDLGKISIYPGFMGQEIPNYTANWYPHIKIQNKALLIGDDVLFQIQNWYNFEKLANTNIKFIVVARQHKDENKKLCVYTNNFEFEFIDTNPYYGVSSTDIRKLKEWP